MNTADRRVSPRRALLLEDDDAVRRSLQLLLHWQGYDVRSFATAEELLASADISAADVLVADYRLPDRDGCDVRRQLRQQGWEGRSVLITGFFDTDLIADAVACGYDVVLEKPLRQRALFCALA